MIDYTKRPKVSAAPPNPVTPHSVKRALELYELWDKRVAEAKASNADPLRKTVKVPFYERSDAAHALARATREWIDRTT